MEAKGDGVGVGIHTFQEEGSLRRWIDLRRPRRRRSYRSATEAPQPCGAACLGGGAGPLLRAAEVGVVGLEKRAAGRGRRGAGSSQGRDQNLRIGLAEG
jgi:hypothetical protein